MSAQGAHKITEEFEKELCRYTGAPFAVAVDSCCNALSLCLWRTRELAEWWTSYNGTIRIPSRTYPGVPSEIILAGAHVQFLPVHGTGLSGAYRLEPTRIWDSALRFTSDMYLTGQLMCLSFTGPYKHLKLGKGGAILCDHEADRDWFKKARFSGRSECSYHEDSFTMLGKNYYMTPEVAARGLALMPQFYNLDGSKRKMEDLTLPYPDLSRWECYRQ